MPERDFFEKKARDRVRQAIENVEAQTSAELVVSVRRQSSKYRHIDLAAGSIGAFVVLLVVLFHPWTFAIIWIPTEVALGFLIGAFISSTFWGLKRILVGKKGLQQATWRAACTTFYEKGVTRTSGRNGLLVFVSMLERRVEVVTDIGIDTEALGTGWVNTVEGIRNTIRSSPDLDRFATALEALGPILGAAMPRAEDDVNELSDELDVS